jgi:hypothetical protein
MKFATSRFSRLLSLDNDLAAESTWADAPPA